MTQRDNGGPAFPWPGQGVWVPEKGMTLLDYFAAKAMQGYVSRVYDVDSGAPNAETISEWAYALADVMLKERAK